MAFKMPHIAVIARLVAAGIALVFQIIAVAGKGWLTFKSQDVNYGLWELCDSYTCADIPSEYVTNWLKATRAFGILALIFIAGALVVGVLSMFIENKFLPLIATGVACLAALCVLISFAVFADKRKSLFADQLDLSYCFALTGVAFVLCVGSGVCFILSNLLGSSTLCVLILVPVYAAKSKTLSENLDLSYCFPLTVVAFVVCIGSGVCFLLSNLLGI